MNRARRTRILVNGSAALRSRLAAEVTAGIEVHELERPRETLVMLTARDSARGSLFHPGEMLVTEARARIERVIGLGIAAGSCPEKAWELAVIDAACNARLPLTGKWDELLLREEERLREEAACEQARILETRVNFETMDIT